MRAREEIGTLSMLRLIHRTVTLVRILPTLDLSWVKKERWWKRNWFWLCGACSTPEATTAPISSSVAQTNVKLCRCNFPGIALNPKLSDCSCSCNHATEHYASTQICTQVSRIIGAQAQAVHRSSCCSGADYMYCASQP